MKQGWEFHPDQSFQKVFKSYSIWLLDSFLDCFFRKLPMLRWKHSRQSNARWRYMTSKGRANSCCEPRFGCFRMLQDSRTKDESKPGKPGSYYFSSGMTTPVQEWIWVLSQVLALPLEQTIDKRFQMLLTHTLLGSFGWRIRRPIVTQTREDDSHLENSCAAIPFEANCGKKLWPMPS